VLNRKTSPLLLANHEKKFLSRAKKFSSHTWQEVSNARNAPAPVRRKNFTSRG